MFVWLASKLAGTFGGVAGKLFEAIVALALLLALVGGPYWLGMRHQAQTDQVTLQQAQLARAAQVAQQTARGEQIASALQTTQTRTQIVYRTIVKEVPHVVTVYRPAPDAPLQPLPHAVFTVAFARLWNHALDPELSGATGSAVDTAAAADALDDSGLDEAAVLNNHITNAESCTAVRQQLGALIRWHQTVARP